MRQNPCIRFDRAFFFLYFDCSICSAFPGLSWNKGLMDVRQTF